MSITLVAFFLSCAYIVLPPLGFSFSLSLSLFTLVLFIISVSPSLFSFLSILGSIDYCHIFSFFFFPDRALLASFVLLLFVLLLIPSCNEVLKDHVESSGRLRELPILGTPRNPPESTEESEESKHPPTRKSTPGDRKSPSRRQKHLEHTHNSYIWLWVKKKTLGDHRF